MICDCFPSIDLCCAASWSIKVQQCFTADGLEQDEITARHIRTGCVARVNADETRSTELKWRVDERYTSQPINLELRKSNHAQ